MMTFLLILLFVSISFFDYVYMLKAKKKRNKKEIFIYTAILGVAFVISELHILEIKVVGLNQIVTYFMNFFR